MYISNLTIQTVHRISHNRGITRNSTKWNNMYNILRHADDIVPIVNNDDLKMLLNM